MKALIALLLFAGPVLAQTKTAPAQGPPPKKLTKTADGHFSANSDPAVTDPFEIHVVQLGETLSGIARTALDDSRLWPQLWEQNEHIVNPHWIYPNDKVLVRKIVKITEIPPPQEEPIVPAPLPPLSVPAAPKLETPKPPPAVAAPIVIGPEPESAPTRIQYPTLILSARNAPPAPRKPVDAPVPEWKAATEIKRSDLDCSGFIRTEAVPNDLKIIGRFNGDSAALATAADYVYLNLGSERAVKAGSVYQVIRPTRRIDDPGRKSAERNLGTHYLEVGQVKVVLIQEDSALARVSNSCEPLEIGDLMIPFHSVNVPDPPRSRPFSPTMTASGEAKGTVVTAKSVLVNFGSTFKGTSTVAGVGHGGLTAVEQGISGEGGIVYLNIGRTSGTKAGDVFIVFRDPSTDRKVFPLPLEASVLSKNRVAIGELIILKVEEKAATAVVSYATDGIAMGDTVERRSPLSTRR